MIKKVYTVRREHYDYFGGQKTEYHHFDTLLEAWAEYKDSKKYDYSYDDGSFSSTDEPFSYFKYEEDFNREHARTRSEWIELESRKHIKEDTELWFDEEELEYLKNLWCKEDEEIYI